MTAMVGCFHRRLLVFKEKQKHHRLIDQESERTRSRVAMENFYPPEEKKKSPNIALTQGIIEHKVKVSRRYDYDLTRPSTTHG